MLLQHILIFLYPNFIMSLNERQRKALEDETIKDYRSIKNAIKYTQFQSVWKIIHKINDKIRKDLTDLSYKYSDDELIARYECYVFLSSNSYKALNKIIKNIKNKKINDTYYEERKNNIDIYLKHYKELMPINTITFWKTTIFFGTMSCIISFLIVYWVRKIYYKR